jgi:hypothetical protein
MQTKSLSGGPFFVACSTAQRKAAGLSAICETKGAKAVLNKLKKDGVPNKAVDAHFNETKTQARKRKHWR